RGGRAAGADRVVTFEQCSEQVGERLQRPYDTLAQREREAPPEPDDEQAEGPHHLRCVRTEDEQCERERGARDAGAERQQQYLVLECDGGKLHDRLRLCTDNRYSVWRYPVSRCTDN